MCCYTIKKIATEVWNPLVETFLKSPYKRYSAEYSEFESAKTILPFCEIRLLQIVL